MADATFSEEGEGGVFVWNVRLYSYVQRCKYWSGIFNRKYRVYYLYLQRWLYACCPSIGVADAINVDEPLVERIQFSASCPPRILQYSANEKAPLQLTFILSKR